MTENFIIKFRIWDKIRKKMFKPVPDIDNLEDPYANPKAEEQVEMITITL